MSPFLALRRARHLCTAAAAAAAAAEAVSTKPLTLSQLKSRLRKVYDPDEALRIYSSFTATSDPAASPFVARHAQDLTVRRLAKCHRYSEIVALLESHKSLPQIKHEPFLSSVIRSYGIVGMLENAVNTYNQMDELGTLRTPLSFNSLLSACVHCRAFDRVPAFFEEFPARFGFRPDMISYGILIKAYCEMGFPEKAMEKLKELEEEGFGVSAISFTTILHALYKKGMIDESKEFWDEMVLQKGCSPDVGSYNVRLRHAHSGKLEDVKGLMEEMENLGIKPDAISFNYLMTCYCLNGMMDEAKKVYDDMLKAKGRKPNAATYRILVFHLCKNGRYVTAYKVFKQSVEVRRIPDFNTLKYLVEGLAMKGHTDEAKALVRTMSKNFPPDLLKAWEKLVEGLGLARVGAEEINSSEIEKGAESSETGIAST